MTVKKETKKVGVIITHPGRNNDYRIDIYEVPVNMNNIEIHEYVMFQMLGPFQIVSITERISFDCKIK